MAPHAPGGTETNEGTKIYPEFLLLKWVSSTERISAIIQEFILFISIDIWLKLQKNWYNMIRITRRVSDLTLPWWKLTIIPFVWRGDGIAYKKFWRWRNIWRLIWPNRNGSDSCPLLRYADFPAFLWRKTCDRRSANEPFHHNMKERYTKYFFTIGT